MFIHYQLSICFSVSELIQEHAGVQTIWLAKVSRFFFVPWRVRLMFAGQNLSAYAERKPSLNLAKISHQHSRAETKPHSEMLRNATKLNTFAQGK